ncbi:hypothetical protein SBRY_140116 [Actinacidiphila bryophytorum]|uniref:Uncharacterized protein n=1 Tax=Actinacidiphila bryophytorum TaxID=1436133 RepID=A0A9W4E6F9_9ACTN|nr:hypothetical protein SBRY_140116 [Actinacidiphila bryophytorum]
MLNHIARGGVDTGSLSSYGFGNGTY